MVDGPPCYLTALGFGNMIRGLFSISCAPPLLSVSHSFSLTVSPPHHCRSYLALAQYPCAHPGLRQVGRISTSALGELLSALSFSLSNRPTPQSNPTSLLARNIVYIERLTTLDSAYRLTADRPTSVLQLLSPSPTS